MGHQANPSGATGVIYEWVAREVQGLFGRETPGLRHLFFLLLCRLETWGFSSAISCSTEMPYAHVTCHKPPSDETGSF